MENCVRTKSIFKTIVFECDFTCISLIFSMWIIHSNINPWVILVNSLMFFPYLLYIIFLRILQVCYFRYLRFFPSGRFLYKVIIWRSFLIHFKNIWFSYMCDWLYEKLILLYRILLKRSRMWWSAWTFGHPNQTLSLVDTTHWQMTRYVLSLSHLHCLHI
jgi:hypothetical protein